MTSDQDAVENAIKHFQKWEPRALLLSTRSKPRPFRFCRMSQGIGRRVMLVMGEAQTRKRKPAGRECCARATPPTSRIYTIGLSTTAAELRTQDQYPPAIDGAGGQPIPSIAPGTPQTPDAEQETAGEHQLAALAQWIVQRGTNEGEKITRWKWRPRPPGPIPANVQGPDHAAEAMDDLGGELHAHTY